MFQKCNVWFRGKMLFMFIIVLNALNALLPCPGYVTVASSAK